MITINDFKKLDMRVGTILEAEPLEGLRHRAYRLKVDFGKLGEKVSSVQITDHYTPGDLVGRQVIAVVNFPPKQIGKFTSEVLVMGAYAEDGTVHLLKPEKDIANGARLK